MKTGTQTEIIITIPRHPPSGNELRREYRHWAAYKNLKDSWERDIYFCCKSDARDELEGLRDAKTKMHIRINIGRQRVLDTDNAYSGVKPILDALRNLKLLWQDSPKYLELEVTQFQSPKSSTEIGIRICEK